MALAIIVHGGAGDISADDQPQDLARACLRAAEAGYHVLKQGGSAVDACVAAAVLLEDDPRFNAGTGAALNEDGECELDASLMDGQSLDAGAVALVKTLKNPILLARKVMESSPHVLLAGDGAERFAKAQGFAQISNRDLVTPRAEERWKKAQGGSHGTIGVAAADSKGAVAAATSTGGTANKKRGRIGDSPLIGCGTYADSQQGAASATGHGESIIKVTLTRHVVDLLGSNIPIGEACIRAIQSLHRVSGEGGIIAVTPRGLIGAAFNTQRMSRAWVTETSTGCGFLPE